MSSSPPRIELRTSNLIRAALLVLAACAALAVLRSELPRTALLAVPLLLVVAWRQLGRPPWEQLVLRSDGSAAGWAATGDEVALTPRQLQRRGPLWVLEVETASGRRTLLFGPDTLDGVQRRGLRLWMERHLERESTPSGVQHV
jgi:hypothetical protein